MITKLTRLTALVRTVIGLWAYNALVDVYWDVWGYEPVSMHILMPDGTILDVSLGTARMRLEELRRTA